MRELSKIKVCILTSVHPALDSRIFYREALSLKKAGYNVVLIAPHHKDEFVNGIKIISLPKARNRFERMTKVLVRLFKLALTEKADIYHFHDPELIPVGLALKLLRKKVVYDVHEDNPEQIPTKEWIPKPFRNMMGILFGAIESFSAKYFNAIITVTESIGHRFEKRKQTLILFNFPELSLFNNVRGDNIFDVIHVGVLSKSRIEFFFLVGLELKKMGHNFKWCILGMQDELKPWVEERINRLDVESIKENFVFVDRVPHNELIKYLSASKIGVNHHPPEKRLKTAIPVKIFEYMACGLPVVCSDLTTIHQFLADENCAILIKPNDVTEFAKGIRFLLSNPEKAKVMGNNGRDAVLKKYNWSVEVGKLLYLYESLLKNN
jgi:glycosyltransferase involved in cell wall biosynthesis